MLLRQLEIDGKKYTLGEATSGAVEEAQDVLGTEGTSEKEKIAAMRRFISHCLTRGGLPIDADALAQQFTVTEIAFLFRNATQVSGLRDVPQGEVLRP